MPIGLLAVHSAKHLFNTVVENAHLAPLRDRGVLTAETLEVDSCWPHLNRRTSVQLQGVQGLESDLAHITHLGNCKELILCNYIFDESDLIVLANSSVETLVIESTSVGDSTIPYLSELKQLRELRLYNTAVTPAGVTALQRRLPKTRVTNATPEPLPFEPWSRDLAERMGVRSTR